MTTASVETAGWSRRGVLAVTRRSWLRSGLRRRIADRLVPDSAEAFEVTTGGCRLRGRLDSHIDRDVFFLGGYEPVVRSTLMALAAQSPAPILLDVGANIGVHTVLTAKSFREVHAFEPFPPLAQVLEEHIRLNALTNVRVHRVGLGEADMDGSYAAPADGRAGYGGFDNPDPNLPRHRLPIRGGTAYLQHAGVGRLSVVKIDVEGSEARVVQGLRARLDADRPALVLEFWPQAWPSGLLGGLPAGYRAWELREPRSVLGLFQAARPALGPAEGLTGGEMVLALPDERPLPALLAIS